MIVVTGAAGFIGSNIVAALEEEGRGPIVVADWLGTDEKWRNLSKRRIAAFVVPPELFAFMDAQAETIDTVIHMGAISSTTERDVDRLVALNVNYTVRLWDWCANHHARFVYASSAATYGGIEKGFVDDDSVRGLAALRPLNAYGWSKKATDDILAARAADGRKTPRQWVGLKFFNVYGPNEYHKGSMRSVAAKIHESVTEGETVQLFRSYRDDFRDGEQRRDFIHVQDCARTILWLLDHPAVSGIYNLGTGHARSFLDLVEAIGAALGGSLDYEFIDMPSGLRDRYQYFTEADMARLRGLGMDFPFRSLEDGVRDYVQSFLACRDRYR